MSNIFDYLKWRGDLSLEQSEFNGIDNLILSRFSYFPFDKIIKDNETITIKELSERFLQQDVNTLPILWKDDVNLFPAMGQSKRFGNMLATKYINKVNLEQEKQFSAITVLMPDNTIYISYRGTDNTIVGWKEDFNMSFKSHVASQIDSVKYLEKIAEQYPNKLRIGGHSKGGNLAVYASTFINQNVKDRIINVYNNDGPGFSDEIVETKDYKQIIDKVHTFIPQSSIIGRLLNHEEKYTVVQSTQTGIMQHDLYSWEVLGKEFVCLDEVTNGSEFVDKTIKEWLERVEPKQREEVIDVLFDILNTTDSDTMAGIKTKLFTNTKIMLQTYKNLDEESKKMISQTVSALIGSVKDNIFGQLPKFSEKTDKKLKLKKD